ncbi:MAG: P-loop NTPase fold protein [Elusimicrobiales bacterium]
MSSKCRTKFLSDNPADSDNLGGHRKIAEAIADIVRDSEDEMTIGLCGEWGSGKSTIIRLLGKELSEDTYAVFTFDAWAHQGDPLRRCFLEAICVFLFREGCIDEDKYHKTKELLAIRQMPVITQDGIAFAFSLLLVPIGIKLLCFSMPLPIIGAILCAFPFISGIHLWTNSPNTLSLLLKSPALSPEQSTIEFERIFSELLRYVQEKNDKRKIVCCIDNLDRIPERNALEIWASLRVFHDALSRKGNNHKNFWLIVPFDMSALNKLWSSEKQQAEQISLGNNTMEDNALAEAFSEKTFQIKFYVPSPVVSSWVGFLKKSLEEALPEHKQDDFDAISRIFRKRYSGDIKKLTPRKIKFFVNRIAALHKIWNDTIPIHIQALYVCFEQKFCANPGGIFDDKEIPHFDVACNISQWKEYMAMMCLNLPLRDAMQILIEPEIENGIREVNLELISKFEGVTGFSETCEKVLEGRTQEWHTSGGVRPEFIFRVIATIRQIKTFHESPQHRIWEILQAYVLRLESFGDLRESSKDALQFMAIHYSNADLLSHILKVLNNDLRTLVGTDAYDDFIEVIHSFHQGGHGEIIRKHVHVDLPITNYTRLVSSLDKLYGNTLDCYFRNSSDKSDDVLKNFQKSDIGDIVPKIIDMNPDWKWDTLCRALIYEFQRKQDRYPQQLVTNNLRILLHLRENPVVSEKLPTLSQDDFFKIFIGSECPPEAILFVLAVMPSLAKESHSALCQTISVYSDIRFSVNNPKNPKFDMRNFCELAIKHNCLKEVLSSYKKYEPLKNLVIEIAREVSVSHPDYKDLIPEEISL